MGRVKYLRIENYRSVKEQISVRVPDNAPLVLVGRNNAGKSNIALALDLVIGESWPGFREPEDHEFFERSKANQPIKIAVDVDGVDHTYYGNVNPVEDFTWTYSTQAPTPGTQFMMTVAGQARRPNNETRGQCVCIYVGADRRLSYQLGYASKFTLLSRLMQRFHSALTSDDQRTAALRQKFEEVKAVFDEVTEFSDFTVRLQSQLAEFSANLEYDLGIDFSAYDPSNYFHALRVQASQNGDVRTFDEMGTGQQQLLAFAFVQAYAEAFHGAGGLLLLVEEPEAHLHPLAQRWLAKKMRALVDAGVQVVITTHSPAFVNVLDLDGIAVVKKVNHATKVTQLTRERLLAHCVNHGAVGATAESILPFYAAAATSEILSGLFAPRIVLVEGPTEALALPTYWGRVGFEADKEGVVVIPVMGVGNLSKWWRFFTAYGIPTYVVFDNDAGDDNDKSRRSDVLAALGVPTADMPAILNSPDWIVEDRYAVFGGNFEQTLRSTFGAAYGALEVIAESSGLAGNQSKPLKARYVAERIPLVPGTQPYEQFRSLADRVAALA